MDKNSNHYTLFFAIAMCVVLAAALAATFNVLKPNIDKNRTFDKNKNVLIATGLYDGKAEKSQSELEKLFADKVVAKVLKLLKEKVDETVKEKGVERTDKVLKVTKTEVTDHKVEDLPALKREVAAQKKQDEYEYGTVYIADLGDGKKSYCIPIAGYGLWSTLYGFLALEGDLDTVRGITFYQHGETPGLGGEVDKDWWRKDWPGKKILDKGRLVSIKVLRSRGNADRGPHEVDGISGATITCNGVTTFVKADLQRYSTYFADVRKGGH